MPGRPLPLMRRVVQLVLAVVLVAPLLAGAHARQIVTCRAVRRRP